MGNEKVQPTEREVRLAKVVSGLSLGVDALLRHREKISEVLSEICEHIDESTEAAMVELEGLNRDLRESMPELFSGVEEPANCDEDSEEPKPPLAYGQWVKIKKPAKNESPNIQWNSHMDRFDGKIRRVSAVYSKIGSRSATLQWYVKLAGAVDDSTRGDKYNWSFDPAWLTPLPDLTEGWRYLQPDELVAAGDKFCALAYLRDVVDWWSSGNVGKKQASEAVYRRRIPAEAPAEGKTEGEAVAEVAEAPKPAWEPKEGDWVTITKPTHANRGWVSPFMDEYDGETFQFKGEFRRDSQSTPWTIGPGGYYFDLAWLSPAPAKVAVPEADDADEWRVVHPGDVGSIIQVRDSEDASHDDSRWIDRKLVAVIATRLEDSPQGTFVCAAKHGNETRVCHTWKFARIAKQKPAAEPQPEAPEPEKDQYFAPSTKVKILHPDCLGRTGTTSWENCPVPNCLFVWVDSEDPVLRVGAIPIHKKWLAPA
jgi:hypothetical protein